MRSIHTVTGVACSFLLVLGLSHIGQAEHSPGPSDVMKTDSLTEAQKHSFQSDDNTQQNVKEKKGSNHAREAKLIKGELFRVKDGNYFIKQKDGPEVRLHTDKTTKMIGTIQKGDQIEAMITEQNHALSIRSTQ